VLLWVGLPLAPSLRDVGLALTHGGVVLAAGLVLFARGSRVVPGVTLVMLAQAETVAAPFWAYLAQSCRFPAAAIPSVADPQLVLALSDVDGK